MAAEHYSADSLVHFGHSCLSQVDKIPVFYVFEKYELDLNQVREELDKITEKMRNKELTETRIIIVYDVSYNYLYGKQ